MLTFLILPALARSPTHLRPHLRPHLHTRLLRTPMANIQTEASASPALTLDRSLFDSTLQLYALSTSPRLCHTLRKLLKSHLLTMPRTHVVAKPDQNNSVVSSPSILLLTRYLAHLPSTSSDMVRGNTDASHVEDPSAVIRKLEASCTPDLIREATHKAKTKTKKNKDKPSDPPLESFLQNISTDSLTVWPLKLSYEHCSIDHVLSTILPSGMTIPSSFESVGHIAHINLRDEHAAWKKLIGQVMLDKLSPRIRTIVNKLESTGGPYRTFAMEVLAGEHNFVTSVRENNCRFNLNFEHVYWNSRLETEHRRIVDLIQDDEIFVDAFCGVGPFAIPAAKRGRCGKVYANDLNPSSVKYLNENIATNAIANASSTIVTSCGCARQFLSKLVRQENIAISRVVMNFPSGAPEFLDIFKGLYNEWDGDLPRMPIVHCYCFIKGELETNSARDRVRSALFGNALNGKSILKDEEIDVRVVRDVAPKKVQVCVTFTVPQVVAYDRSSVKEPNPKRQKVGPLNDKRNGSPPGRACNVC